MAADKVGRFLFEKGVAPDEFAYIRTHMLNDDIATIQGEGWMGVFFTDEHGRLKSKLAPQLLRLATLGVNFTVSFIDGDQPKETTHLEPDDTNQFALIEVWFDEDTQQPVFCDHNGHPLNSSASEESTLF